MLLAGTAGSYYQRIVPEGIRPLHSRPMAAESLLRAVNLAGASAL